MKRLLFLLSLLAFSTLAFATLVNLNAATEAELAALPRIGADKAKAIVAFRTANGCFKTIGDLSKVNGVTRTDIEAISSLVVVGSCPQEGGAKSKAQT